jgi:hypothetical protein
MFIWTLGRPSGARPMAVRSGPPLIAKCLLIAQDLLPSPKNEYGSLPMSPVEIGPDQLEPPLLEALELLLLEEDDEEEEEEDDDDDAVEVGRMQPPFDFGMV